MNNPFIVSTLEEAANEGYRQGFEEGYTAARIVVKMVADAWRKEPWAYDLDGALKGLDMSREKAVEMMGTPKFITAAVPVAAQPTNKVQ